MCKPALNPEIKKQVDAINQEASQKIDRDRRGMIDLLNRGLILAAPDGIQNPIYPLGAAESHILLGRYYLGKCNYSKALPAFRNAAQLSRLAGSTRPEILCRSYLAVISGLMADPSQALQFSQEALRSAQMLQDPLLEAEVLIHLCYLEILCDQPAQAIKSLEPSIQILRAQQDPSLLGKALEIQGQAYLKNGEDEKALKCLQECLLLDGAEQQTANLLRWKKIIGDIYQSLHQTESAIDSYQQMIDLSRQIGENEAECQAWLSIAEIYQKEQQVDQAMPILNRALEIANQTGTIPLLQRCYQLLSRTNKKRGDFKAALEFHEKYCEISRKVIDDLSNQQFRNMTTIQQLEDARREAETYHLRAKALEEEIEEQRKQQATLKQLAMMDSLTGILNRRAFREIAHQACQRAHEHREPLALILVDVDHFKRVNDTYGHQVGDQALAVIANRLKKNIRPADWLGRLGGEEFLILQPGVDEKAAWVTARRLCDLFCSQPVHLDGLDLPITLSFGISAYKPNDGAVTLDELIQQADQAMYRVKKSGRNGVSIFSGKYELVPLPRKPGAHLSPPSSEPPAFNPGSIEKNQDLPE